MEADCYRDSCGQPVVFRLKNLVAIGLEFFYCNNSHMSRIQVRQFRAIVTAFSVSSTGRDVAL